MKDFDNRSNKAITHPVSDRMALEKSTANDTLNTHEILMRAHAHIIEDIIVSDQSSLRFSSRAEKIAYFNVDNMLQAQLSAIEDGTDVFRQPRDILIIQQERLRAFISHAGNAADYKKGMDNITKILDQHRAAAIAVGADPAVIDADDALCREGKRPDTQWVPIGQHRVIQFSQRIPSDNYGAPGISAVPAGLDGVASVIDQLKTTGISNSQEASAQARPIASTPHNTSEDRSASPG